MPIDITSLSYEELLELQRAIKERLQYLDSENPRSHPFKLHPGDQVYFSHPRHGKQTATIISIGKKTVTVVTGSGQRWDVAPHLLRKSIKTKRVSGPAAKIIPLKDK